LEFDRIIDYKRYIFRMATPFIEHIVEFTIDRHIEAT